MDTRRLMGLVGAGRGAGDVVTHEELHQRLATARAVLVPKQDSPLMRAIALVIGQRFLATFWTTWRLPFQRNTRIGYPSSVADPEKHAEVILHELVHAEQFRPFWGPLVVGLAVAILPLPVLFSGRWFVERRAYLEDIKRGTHTVDGAIWILWNYYGWPWPPALMRRWFNRQLERGAT